MKTILVPVSAGELADKITILRIRRSREMDPVKLSNMASEIEALEETWLRFGGRDHEVDDLVDRLAEINSILWDIEDKIREKESLNSFDSEFVELARSVYKNNDRRAALKREISVRCGSAIVEEKSYRKY